ncbi:aminoacyl-tRNA deacylase [Tsukamurella soli]|uniref:aminoacyl-tRNA deacylase n=1 Tax=Tsukamurella soli TaxID=644556 RepID=UPI00360D123C
MHEYVHDPAVSSYGDEAVAALGVDPAAVFKTLVITDGTRFGVALVPVAARLSLKAAGAALGMHRPALADPADVTRVTGYVLGGVSPVGQRRRLATVVDESAARHPTVYCSAGRRGLEIELAPADLLAATGASTAPLTAG